MLPSHHNNHLLLLPILLRLPRDGHLGHIVPADSETDRLDREFEGVERVLMGEVLGFLEEGDHLGVAVGQGHCDEDEVVLVIECEIEGQAVELAVGRLLYINRRLLIEHIPGPPAPPLALPALVQGEHGRLAPVLKKGMLLFLE